MYRFTDIYYKTEIFNLLLPLMLTLLIECLVISLYMRYRKHKTDLWVKGYLTDVILINAFTNLLLNTVLMILEHSTRGFLFDVYDSFIGLYIIYIVILFGEIWVWLFEAYYYHKRWFLKSGKCLWISFIANISSFIIGTALNKVLNEFIYIYFDYYYIEMMNNFYS